MKNPEFNLFDSVQIGMYPIEYRVVRIKNETWFTRYGEQGGDVKYLLKRINGREKSW